MKKISLLLMTFLLLGCAKPFQPAPFDYQRWKKSGYSDDEVKNSMLECGFNSPFNNGKMEDNSYAKAQRCMVKKGFSHDYERGIFCDKRIYQHLPACQRK